MKTRKLPHGNHNLIGKWVVIRRKELGMSQLELLALLANEGLTMSISSLSQLEGQKRLVSDIELFVLSKVLQVSVSYLFGITQK